jgi:hypothetical protein
MSERKSSLVDSARRLAELRQAKTEPPAPDDDRDLEVEQEDTSAAFSMISADRQQKVMVDFRQVNGNSKALAYSYLVACEFDASEGIKLDFSGYAVTITGRHLRPLFDGLVAQRVAVVRAMDLLNADANLPATATVVTGIDIKTVD